MLRSIRSTIHASTRQLRFGLQSSLVSPLLLAASDRGRVDSQPRLGASWQSPILLSTNDALVWVFSWFSRPSLGFSVTSLADSHGLINLLFLFASPLCPPLPSPSLPVPPPHQLPCRRLRSPPRRLQTHARQQSGLSIIRRRKIILPCA